MLSYDKEIWYYQQNLAPVSLKALLKTVWGNTFFFLCSFNGFKYVMSRERLGDKLKQFIVHKNIQVEIKKCNSFWFLNEL